MANPGGWAWNGDAWFFGSSLIASVKCFTASSFLPSLKAALPAAFASSAMDVAGKAMMWSVPFTYLLFYSTLSHGHEENRTSGPRHRFLVFKGLINHVIT